ncbi:MAG: family 20 glycosylhydrolase [Bacteroidota bacterium]
MNHRIILLFSFLFACQISNAQKEPSIIPKPVSLIINKGNFILDQQVSIKYAIAQKSLFPAVNYFVAAINDISGIKINLNKKTDKIIELKIDNTISVNNEGYLIKVTPTQINITAKGYAGIIYGFQTLLQTIPQVRTNAILSIPCMDIIDEPRFKWRGMHLDVSRHFFSIALVKTYIDLMAAYKMNTFHWHLVDDQGWRIEIKKYPKLTSVGAWRVDQTSLVWGTRPQALPGEDPNYGGYYTQEQIKEIIAYAGIRNITVVPEIEMPGHIASAIAAYPELSCSGNFQLPMTGGNYKNMSSNYCAGNEAVFHFVEDVLTEVINLFPSKFIHIGGDEVDKTDWQKCAKCQARIKKEGLKNEDELQSYFVKRIEKFINSKNRKIIGWDEILEGGLAPEAAVMSWRGEKGGIQAANMNHLVVMTPGTPCYFDNYQAGPEGEPLAIGGFNTLKKVYDYEPIPKELNKEKYQYVLGAQANLWTEFITTSAHIEYMVLPRMLALAEVVWSPVSSRNWNDFNRRLKYHFNAFDQKGLHYSPGNYTVDIRPISKDNKLAVELLTESPEAKIYYTTDGSIPTISSNLYQQSFPVSSSLTVKAVTILNGKIMNLKPAEQSFVTHLALGAEVKYKTAYSKYYLANGPNTLTDGIRGKLSHSQSWHGIDNNDLVATIDLGKVKEIKSITIGCLQNYNSWIFMPASVQFEISEDGQNFVSISKVENDIPLDLKAATIKDFKVMANSKQARYIRVTAKKIEGCPKGHPGEGKPAWIFADEIIVE